MPLFHFVIWLHIADKSAAVRADFFLSEIAHSANSKNFIVLESGP